MSQPTRTYRLVIKRASVLLALLLMWATAASDRMPASLSMAAHASRKTTGEAPAHDLSALRIFNRVVLLIKDNYVDPKRIEPRKMLINALDGVERQVAEVLVDGDEKSPSLTITVNKLSKQFDVSEVDTFWRMSFALKEMFDFIDKSLTDRDETREIEYAAVNGMLSTLDPHSILLKPEYFKEMKLQTKGEFGGLGFVIQMKESNLTVVRVLKATPASKAGIKSKDQITRINNESTVNMDLTEAVNRLRGKPGSEVTITVRREGWAAPKPMVLTRAIINVESVSAKMLSDGVGYIRLKGFQGNTARDMRAEIARLKAQAGKPGLKGLVLDMRGNPGGLLEQAIQVSDAFVPQGTLVTTVGYSDKLREVKKAGPEGTEAKLPMVVIVNSGSASASEIVAGALKNLGRAVVIGRQTFGKGSVQVLYDFPDESALKLTIAQYLTPGDISIQEVGITPDIELLPSRVREDRVDVFAPKKLIGEANLDKHFGNPDSDTVASKREEVERREKPLEQLRYLRDEPKKSAKAGDRPRPDRDDYDDLDELEGLDPDTDEIVEDYPIRFARDMLVAAPFSERDKMLAATRGFIVEKRAEERAKIDRAIAALGIDWAAGAEAAGPGRPKLAVEMSPRADEPVRAGDKLAWTVTARNEGDAPFKRLRAYSESENPYLDRREFIFGGLAPGQKRSWTVKIQLPKDMASRRDQVTLKFLADGGPELADLEGELNVVELPRPTFAYTWQLLDRCQGCNGDGLAQLGETVEMAVEVKNLGPGTAFDPIAVLKNKEADEHLSLQKGRAKLGEIAPGDSKSGLFEFEVTPAFKGEAAILQLTIGDEPMDEWVSERLAVPVSTKGETAARVSVTAVRASADLSIRAAADAATMAIAEVKKGTVLPVEAKLGDFYRVKFGTRLGFVQASEVREARPEKAAPAFELLQTRREPKIELDVDLSKGGIVTSGDKYTLTGRALDHRRLRDLYVFVNDQKVFFKAAGEKGGDKIEFSADCPLKEGNNTVLVVARENQDLMARRLLLIHRLPTELARKEGAPKK